MLLATEPVGLDRLEVIADGLDHAEGIEVLDGTIYVDGEAGQVNRVEDDRSEEAANTGGFSMVTGHILQVDGGYPIA